MVLWHILEYQDLKIVFWFFYVSSNSQKKTALVALVTALMQSHFLLVNKVNVQKTMRISYRRLHENYILN